jgi:N-acetylglucosamine kinase-like BadF-type ATPase
MKKAILIAESGGSKTDWCLADRLGNKHFFTTGSYHPHNMTDEWIVGQSEFWREHTAMYDMEVHFFGAGCMNEHNKRIVEKAFSSWHITDVKVSSDLIGAAYALLGKEDGVIGVLGTGSVAAIIKDHQLKQVLGGYGYLLGDEGSGYAFGKKLLYKYLHGAFSDELSAQLKKILGGKEEILKKVYGPIGKKYISGIAKAVNELPGSEEITCLHEQNMEEYIDEYLKKIPELKEISFVGSYAFYHQEILRKTLEIKGIELKKVIERPIEELTEYFLKRTF